MDFSLHEEEHQRSAQVDTLFVLNIFMYLLHIHISLNSLGYGFLKSCNSSPLTEAGAEI